MTIHDRAACTVSFLVMPVSEPSRQMNCGVSSAIASSTAVIDTSITSFVWAFVAIADALLGTYDLNTDATTTSPDPNLQLLQLRNPWGQPPAGSTGFGTWRGAWSDGAAEWSRVPNARAVTGYHQVRKIQPSTARQEGFRAAAGVRICGNDVLACILPTCRCFV